MAVGMKAFFESLASGPTKYMIFGGACEAVTAPIAAAVHFWNLVQLSYADTTATLSDRIKYPQFFRTVPSEVDIGAARIRLFHFFNWTRIATIHQDIGQYSFSQTQQVKMAIDNDIKLLAQESFNDDPTMAIKNLKKEKARIIIGFFNEEAARQVFCQAYQQKLYGAHYVWLLPGYFTEHWWRSLPNDSDCTSDQLEQVIRGYIATEILPISSSQDVSISGFTPREYEHSYELNRTDEFSIYHGYAYDGIWVMALALDNVINTLKTRGELHRFTEFDYEDEEMLDLFSRAMNETNFRGVTDIGSKGAVICRAIFTIGDKLTCRLNGVVQFKDGERMGSVMHKQLQGDTLEKVAEYYSITDSLNTTTGDTRSLVWQGDMPPQDWPESHDQLLTVSIVLFAIMSSIASAGIVMAVAFFFFNMKYRNQRYIKMSSPYLNNLILFGGILSYISVYFLGLDMGLLGIDAFQAVCAARAWFLCLGFTFSYGAMFGKTWRVHKIFTNIKMKKKVIKDNQLFLLVGVLVIMDLIVLILWQTLDPLRPEKQKLSDRPDPTGADIIITPIVYNCNSDKKMIWLSSLYIYKGVLMIFGLFLAWETRHVSIPALNDSKYIGMSVYNVVIMCVLGVSLSAIIQDDHNASYGLVSIFILFCTTITLCLVFGPKVIELRKNPNPIERIRVMGTFDKSVRTSSVTPNSMDADAKTKLLTNEQVQLKKKLEEHTKKISELEEKLHSVAPEEASLLLNEELRMEDSFNSTGLSLYSRATEVSRISAFPSIQGGIKVCVQEPSSDQSNRNSSSSQGRSKYTSEMDDDEKSEFYGEFGGVYLGPSDDGPSECPPPETTKIPDMLTLPDRTLKPRNIAQVHRSFDEEDSFISPEIELDLPSTQHLKLKDEIEMDTLRGGMRRGDSGGSGGGGGGARLSIPSLRVFNGRNLLD